MKFIYTVIIVLLMLFIITFSLENTVPIRLKYYDIINISLPTYMLVFITFLIGVIFTGFMGIVERFRLKNPRLELIHCFQNALHRCFGNLLTIETALRD